MASKETNREDDAPVVDNRATVKTVQKKSERVAGKPKVDDGESSRTVEVLLLTLELYKTKEVGHT